MSSCASNSPGRCVNDNLEPVQVAAEPVKQRTVQHVTATRSPDAVEFLRVSTGSDETAAAVVSAFATWDEVRSAGVATLMRYGVSAVAAQTLINTPTPPPVSGYGRVVTKYTMTYPPGVRDLPSPPIALYVKGTLPEGPAVLIAGSAVPSPIGVEVAKAAADAVNAVGATALWVAEEGVGMAAGLSLDPARSIMVVPHGLDVPSPVGYAAERVLAGGGAVVSAFSSGVGMSVANLESSYKLGAAWAECVLLAEFSVLPSGGLVAAQTAVSLDRAIVVPERVHDSAEAAPIQHMTVAGADTLTTRDVLDTQLYPGGSRAYTRSTQGLTPADYVVSSTRQLREVLAHLLT